MVNMDFTDVSNPVDLHNRKDLRFIYSLSEEDFSFSYYARLLCKSAG